MRGACGRAAAPVPHELTQSPPPQVPDLKQLCDSYGVAKTGKKGDIIDRLLQAQADELGMTVKVAHSPAPLPITVPRQRCPPDDMAHGRSHPMQDSAHPADDPGEEGGT